MALVGPIIAVHFVSVVAQAIYLLLVPAAQLNEVFAVAGNAMPMRQILIGAMVLDGVIGVLLFALYYAAWTSPLQLEFFRPLEFRTLTALTEVMIAGHNEAIPPEAAARNGDQALARVRAERKGSFRIALAVIHLWPLFSLHPPLPELRPALRSRFIRERFTRDAGRRQKWRLIRTMVQDPLPGRAPALGARLLQRPEGPLGDSLQTVHGAGAGVRTFLAASPAPPACGGTTLGP